MTPEAGAWISLGAQSGVQRALFPPWPGFSVLGTGSSQGPTSAPLRKYPNHDGENRPVLFIGLNFFLKSSICIKISRKRGCYLILHPVSSHSLDLEDF